MTHLRNTKTRIPNPESLFTAMRRACAEARVWLGSTSPNPPVGAVALDEDENILAVAAHQKAGEDHAEAALIKYCREKGILSRVATIAVTLEPCAHTGRTPPCCDTILEAGIRRVAVGLRDPNPHVKGGGCDRLRAAGVDVIEDIEAEECARLMHAFLFYATTGKPFVTVKRAFDERGSMIPPSGQKTFTSEDSLVLAHRLRKKADAIVTGSETVLIDNPLFTVRKVPDFPDKRRTLAVLDRRQRVSKDYILQAAKRGLDVVVYKDLDVCFKDLLHRGKLDILVEAGPSLSRAVMDSDHWTMLVDIRKGNPDKTKLSFNKEATLPFDTAGVSLGELLPTLPVK